MLAKIVPMQSGKQFTVCQHHNDRTSIYSSTVEHCEMTIISDEELSHQRSALETFYNMMGIFSCHACFSSSLSTATACCMALT